MQEQIQIQIRQLLIINNNSLNTNSSSYNTAFGSNTLFTNINGDNNTAIGYNSLYSNTSSDLTAVGSGSLQSNTTGTSNTALGSFSLQSNISGVNNTAVGHSSLRSNINNNFCTALGFSALYSNNADNNTAVGCNAMGFNTIIGTANASYGGNSLYKLSSGNNNTGIGQDALVNLLTGSNNIGLGRSAGSGYTGGESNNICVGSTGISGETGTIRIGTPGTQTSFYVPLNITSLNPNINTTFRQLYYNSSTNELNQYSNIPFINIGNITTPTILSNWDSLVKLTQLINNTIVYTEFPYTITSPSISTLTLPSGSYINTGTRMTILNASIGNLLIFANGININTSRVTQTTSITIGTNGFCELIFVGSSWFAIGNFLT